MKGGFIVVTCAGRCPFLWWPMRCRLRARPPLTRCGRRVREGEEGFHLASQCTPHRHVLFVSECVPPAVASHGEPQIFGLGSAVRA